VAESTGRQFLKISGTLSIAQLIIITMTIYIGNLSWKISDKELHDLFTPFGTVDTARIVTDKFKGNRSKGFGFVEMPNAEEAQAAMTALHQTEVDGRVIVVNESKPREESEKRSFGGDKRSFNRGDGGEIKKDFDSTDF
jgi:RNA recognition motif-containing protein